MKNKNQLHNDAEMMIEPNEKFTHNTQTNTTLHPTNYTNTKTNPVIQNELYQYTN